MSSIKDNITMYACIQVFNFDEDKKKWKFVHPDEISKFAVDSYGFEIEGEYIPLCPYDDEVRYGETAILYKCGQLILDDVLTAHYITNETLSARLLGDIDVISEFYTTFEHNDEIVSCSDFASGLSTDELYKIKIIYLMFEDNKTHKQYFIDSYVLNSFNRDFKGDEK